MNLLQTQLPILPNDPELFRSLNQNRKETPDDHKQYISIIPCLFEVILRQYSKELSPRDIVFFSQVLALYQSTLSKGKESIIYSSEKIAGLLGYKSKNKSNMRSIALRITKKLEQIGLLQVTRGKTQKGTDKINEIIPMLPDDLYEYIKYEPDKHNGDSSRLANESNLQHILRTKLYVPITLEFAKSLFDNPMSNKYKLFFFNCVITAYKNYRINGNLSFAATSRELIQKNNISKRTLFNILQYIKNQAPDFFITAEHKYTNSDDIDSNRYDKSIFTISINPLVIPNCQIEAADSKKSTEKPYTYTASETGVQICKPSSANLYAIIIKKKEERISIKNIDYIDANSLNLSVNDLSDNLQSKENVKKEFLENELCSFPSKFYNNSSFLNDSYVDSASSQQKHCEIASTKQSCSNIPPEAATRIIKNISEKERLIGYEKYESQNNTQYEGEYKNEFNTNKLKSNTKNHLKNTIVKSFDYGQKELKHFYPLSSNDVDTLNFRANREFSVNFVNQLLLKLYIKYPEKRFKNRFTFLSYMEKTLKNEKHQGPLVNHTSFRFSCNINAEEKDMLENERYLSEIENSLDTSRAMQVKKKIAGRFSTNVACSILQQVEFKTNHDNSFVTALIPSSITLSERQIEILSEQLEAVYGINGYYVQEVEDVEDFEKEQERRGKEKEMEIPYPKITKSAIVSNSTPVGILERSGGLDAIEENTAWHQIRSGLIEELGEAIDAAWFSKAVAVECKETSTLTLTMPTRFMADWLNSRYGHIIYRFATSLGFKFIEYTRPLSKLAF